MASSAATSTAAGAGPDALTTITSSPGRRTRAIRSPPSAQLSGYVTVSEAAAASAASSALPPAANAAAPASAADRCGAAIASRTLTRG
jgi:hypothetical protein